MDSQKSDLYALQEDVAYRLQGLSDPAFLPAKLCGGTALARCWLDHRISYDLDYFLPEGFNANKLAMALKKAGIEYAVRDMVDDPHRANQLHGYVVHGDKRLKVSFMEDAYFHVFPAIRKSLGTVVVQTEPVEGLYHRKLRTISGHGAGSDSFEGGRQKARDVFDLHVLSQMVSPLRPFMESLPYSFPIAAFENGLACMPWFDLVDELREIVCEPKWAHAKDMVFLQDALYTQIGMITINDETRPSEDDPLSPHRKPS